MSKKRANQPGHFCWCCQQRRPNERFSGGGHARHLCRDCAKLGADELAYRQGVRSVDRLLTWEGRIRRRQRQNFERFLYHENERIRSYAGVVAARLEQERAQRREDWLVAEEGFRAEVEGIADAEDPSDCAEHDSLDREADSIPFCGVCQLPCNVEQDSWQFLLREAEVRRVLGGYRHGEVLGP